MAREVFSRGVMPDETMRELPPGDILARRRRFGEGWIVAEPIQIGVALRQRFNLPGAPRGLECLRDRRAQAHDCGLDCFFEDSFIGRVVQRPRQADETQLLRPILAGRHQLAHVVGQLVPLPARPVFAPQQVLLVFALQQVLLYLPASG